MEILRDALLLDMEKIDLQLKIYYQDPVLKML